jgi:phosphate-selective porin OprO and OprP
MQTGKGAWEVGYRWSWLDLNDGLVEKGEWSNHTVGLNWYLSPNMRLMWNYVHSTVDPSFNPGHPDSSVDVFEMRTQIDF